MSITKIMARLVAITVVFASAAHATALQNPTGLSGSFSAETFNMNAGAGSLAANQFAGLSFGPGLYVNDSYSGSYPNMQGSVIANFYPCCTNPTIFTFDSIVSDVAFAFASNPETSTFTALLSGNVVESFSASTGFGGTFYGFTNIAFDSIRIESPVSGYIIDNLQYRSAVPEPATLALLGMGLFGIATTRRRKN